MGRQHVGAFDIYGEDELAAEILASFASDAVASHCLVHRVTIQRLQYTDIDLKMMSITGVDEQCEAITNDVDSLEPGKKIPGRAKRKPSNDLNVDLCAEFLVQQRSSSSRGEQNEHDKGDDGRGGSH